jgi:hypothetical protein
MHDCEGERGQGINRGSIRTSLLRADSSTGPESVPHGLPRCEGAVMEKEGSMTLIELLCRWRVNHWLQGPGRHQPLP